MFFLEYQGKLSLSCSFWNIKANCHYHATTVVANFSPVQFNPVAFVLNIPQLVSLLFAVSNLHLKDIPYRTHET